MNKQYKIIYLINNKIILYSLSIINYFIIIIHINNIINIIYITNLTIKLINIIINFIITIIIIPQNKYLHIISYHQKKIISINFINK